MSFPRYNEQVDWSMKWSIKFGSGSLPTRGGAATLIGGLFWKAEDLPEDYTGENRNWKVIAGIDVYRDAPVISVKDKDNMEWRKYSANRQFEENVPYDIELFTRDGNIYFIVNGEVWASGPMNDQLIGVPPVSAHAGLYAYEIEVGSVLFNGPLVIRLLEHRN